MTDLLLHPDTQLVTVEDSTPTPSVLWDRAVQLAVINTTPGPTIASRAYGILHTAMFNAWAAYDPIAVSTQLRRELQRPLAENTIANKTQAMSHAAYQVLSDLFPTETASFDAVMNDLGLTPDTQTSDLATAVGIGNTVATELLTFRHQDGSNQLNNYTDTSNYQPINDSPEQIVELDRWTPEHIPIDDPTTPLQKFLTPHWGNVTPFALTSGEQLRPQPPEPFLLTGQDTPQDGTITLADGTVVEIAPNLVGTVINPAFITQAKEVINFSANLTDEQKLIAEFWEDAGGTSFPPGTWMTFGQFVSARDNHTLDEDAQLFFALGNAVFDAGIATWESKVFYDYTRPVRAIRELGRLGLIGEFNEDLGGYAIQAWQPDEGTQTILATDFLTYQTPGSDPSPPFAEYTSGHSSFSAAGAEVLRRFTGSDNFGAAVTFEPGESRFEPGITPATPTTLAWDTFSEAANEAGVSRLYGGIHFEDGDINGRNLGSQVGMAVFEEAQFFIEGGAPQLRFGTGSDDNNQANPALEVTRRNQVIPTLTFSGSGNDLIDISLSNNSPANDRAYGGSDQDEILVGKNDRAFGGSGDDILDATIREGNNRLYGGLGDDELIAAGNDRLFGGEGNDTLDARNSTGNNRLYGGEGDDILLGSKDDRLIGGEGDDQLIAGSSANVLTGGTGADQFWLTQTSFPENPHIITDFGVGDIIGFGGNFGMDLDEFSDLILTTSDGSTTIRALNQDLAILQGVTNLQQANVVFDPGFFVPQ